MKQSLKLHKWKKYMWVIFDESRPAHGSGKEQDEFLPGLYPILDDVKNSDGTKRLDAEITFSDSQFDDADIVLRKVDDCRYNVESEKTEVELIFLTSRVLKYFDDYPNQLFLKIQ